MEGNLGNLKDSEVVGDGSVNKSILVFIFSLLHIVSKTGNEKGRAVDVAHEEPPEDDLVELDLGPPVKEPVNLHQQSQVNVLRLFQFFFTKSWDDVLICKLS